MKWSEFRTINKSSDLKKYLKQRVWNHTNYYHYTTLKNINSILEKRELWLSNVNGFNDEKDKKQFDGNGCWFSFCFSTGVNENLPLWYLYSGFDGKGGRLWFKKRLVKNIVESAEMSLYGLDGDAEKNPIKTLHSEDVQIFFGDVVYSKTGERKKGKGEVSLKYNNMTNYNFTEKEYEKFKKDNVGFNKGLIWYYEKETRLLVKLDDSIAGNLDQKKRYVIVIKLQEDWMKDMKLTFAPEIESIKGVIEQGEFTEIENFLYGTSQVGLSEYCGQMKISKCDKCEKSKGKK